MLYTGLFSTVQQSSSIPYRAAKLIYAVLHWLTMLTATIKDSIHMSNTLGS